MRVTLGVDELSALQNALATRHDDLQGLLTEWAAADASADPEQVEAAR